MKLAKFIAPLLLGLFASQAFAALSCSTALQASSGVSHGTGAYTTGSYTPTNSSLQVAIVYAMGENNDALAGSDLTFSGTLTWTSRVVSTTHPNWGYAIRIWTAPVTTGSSMTVQADAGTFNVHRYRVEIYQCTGYDTGTPVGATAVGSDADGDAAAAITLSGAPATTSMVYAAALDALNSGAGGVTPGTGWTEIFELSESAWVVFQSQQRTASTSTSVDWNDLNEAGGGSAAGAALVAIEIKESAGGGGGGTQPPRSMHQFRQRN